MKRSVFSLHRRGLLADVAVGHDRIARPHTGRVEERNPSSLKVMVSMSIAAMHYHLTGRAFRQPGAAQDARDRAFRTALADVVDSDIELVLAAMNAAAERLGVAAASRVA